MSKNNLKAIKLQFDAHKIHIESGNERLIAGSYNQIAILYKVQEDYENAILYYKKAIEINKRIGNKL